MQQYTEIAESTTLQASRSQLLNNDKTIMSCFSGTAFPTANLQVGMLCLRTDQNLLYQLKDATPTWVPIMDLSTTQGAAQRGVNGMLLIKAAGSEGGEIQFEKPTTANSLSGNVVMDHNGNQIRIFDGGGTARGCFLDISVMAAGAASKIWHSENDGVGSGLDADLLDGYASNTGTAANTIPVRNGSGQLPGDITGNAATASTAAACSGNAATATLATKASTLSQSGGNGTAMTFNWSGQAGQPSWLWGGSDGVNMYVYNPSNFSVSYATSAGSANALNPSNSYSGQTFSAISYSTSINATAGFTWNDRATANQSWTGYVSSNTWRLFSQTANADRMTLDSSGNLTTTGNQTAYSDERVKTNWRGFSGDFLEKLTRVKSGIYDRTDIEKTQVGVSAQSLREVMPEAVIEDEQGNLSVAYGNAALAAVIELAREVKALRARVAELEAR